MITIPTITQLKDNLLSRLRAEFRVTINSTGDSFLLGLATVLSGLLWLYYQAVSFVQKNIWYDTADSEANGGTLERFGRSILKRNPFAAGKGEYTVSLTATAGSIIPVTAVAVSDDSSEHPGMLFQVTGSYTATGSGDTITLKALQGGTASKLVVGDTLTFTAPIPGVNPVVTVTVETVAPTDVETTEEYRGKIDIVVKTEPGSWSAADYRKVGTGVAGVGQIYAYATSGVSAGVTAYVQGTADIAHPGPSAAPSVVTAYQAALELVLPLGVWTVVYNPSPIKNIDITITMGTFTAYTSDEQTKILNALTAFIHSVHPFIASCDAVADRNDRLATYNISSIISAAVPGKGFSAVTFTVAGTPSTNWLADNGEIPFLNTVTYA